MRTVEYIMHSEQKRNKGVTEDDAKRIYDKALSKGMYVIDIESQDYPKRLKSIENPPLVLYCLGDISLLDKAEIALVGTRRASPYGKWIAKEIGKNLAKCRAVHVSGMAEGIDAAGHRAVIEYGGKSIAVLGTGADVLFPKSSYDIYEELKESGLIVSEYGPGCSGYPSNFPERNRIISGLCSKCIVVEAALRSGSLITAKLALEQGREIYAVPGNINQPNSIGPNLLIADGAMPIANPNEIAETLGIGFSRESSLRAASPGLESDIIRLIAESGSMRVDDLISVIKVSPEKVMASITMLELKGLVKNEDGIVR